MILDSATPMLFKLSELSNGYALDALNYSSLKLKEKMKANMKKYGKSAFGTRFVNGHRLLSGETKGGERGNYFSRFSHSTGKELHDMSNFLKYQVSDRFLHSVVGYIDYKSFKASRYEDGKKIGSIFVHGQGGVKKIGENLEYGGKKTLSEKQKAFFRASGWATAARRGYINRKARPVVNPAFRSMQGQIKGIIQSKYADALVDEINKTNFRGVA